MIIYERKTDTHLYFLRGVFSNFQKCKLKYKNIELSTTEQAFMLEKAIYFQDAKSVDNIIKANTPWEAKAFGRQVTPFNADIWYQICYDIMYDVNVAKYQQNKNFANILLDTKDLILVEANPKDKIWGVGLSADDNDILDEKKWKGENLLGQVLMQIRKELKEGKI